MPLKKPSSQALRKKLMSDYFGKPEKHPKNITIISYPNGGHAIIRKRYENTFKNHEWTEIPRVQMHKSKRDIRTIKLKHGKTQLHVALKPIIQKKRGALSEVNVLTNWIFKKIPAESPIGVYVGPKPKNKNEKRERLTITKVFPEEKSLNRFDYTKLSKHQRIKIIKDFASWFGKMHTKSLAHKDAHLGNFVINPTHLERKDRKITPRVIDAEKSIINIKTTEKHKQEKLKNKDLERFVKHAQSLGLIKTIKELEMFLDNYYFARNYENFDIKTKQWIDSQKSWFNKKFKNQKLK